MTCMSEDPKLDPDEIAIRIMQAQREGRHRQERENVEDKA